MQITMQRQDIIPLPTITETYGQAIDELMDDISLVRTSIFHTSGHVERHLNCVMAREEEIVPMMCAFYALTQSVEPKVLRTIVATAGRSCWFHMRGDVLYKKILLDVFMKKFKDQDIGIIEGAVFEIYPCASYPLGTDWLIKHGQILLCSPWGYEAIRREDLYQSGQNC